MAWSTGLSSQDPEDSDQGREESSAELADQSLLSQNLGIQSFRWRASHLAEAADRVALLL